MIADLRAQKADMAVIDMSITSIRQTAVDFTMPYMTTGELFYSYRNQEGFLEYCLKLYHY